MLITNPIDVAKTRMQMSAELIHKSAAGRIYTGPLDCLNQTFQAEGIRGLQRGLNVAVVREGSKCFFRIGLYDPLVRHMHDGSPSSGMSDTAFLSYPLVLYGVTLRSPPLANEFFALFCFPAPLETRVGAAAISAIIAAVVCNPLDLAKSQVQAAGSPLSVSHHNRALNQPLTSLFRDIIHSRGGQVSALWQGTDVNVIRSITFTCVCLPLNSYLRERVASKVGIRHVLAVDIIASTVASFVGILVMNPLDVVRTRLYNQPGGEARLYLSVGHAVRRIVETEGVTAFWKGCLSHYLRVGPHTVGVLCLSQFLKRKLK